MNLAWLRTSGGSRVSVAGFVAVALFLPRPEITSDMSGFIVFLDSLRTVLAVAGLVSCITVVGSAIVMRLHVVSVPKTLQLAAAFLIGSTVTGSLLMATGLAGLFSVDAVRVICLASTLLLAGPSALGYLRTASKGAIGELLRMREVKGGSWVLIGSALLGLFLLANALGPLFTWDAAMYHIEAPKEFLLAGAIELLPDNEHVAFVSTFQMLNSVLIASSGHAGPAVLHWLSLVLLVWLVAVLASEIDSRRTGVLALALIWSAPILLRHGSEPMTDVYLVLAILALIGWTWSIKGNLSDPTSSMGLTLLSASALLVKYQAGPYVIGTLVVASVTRRRELAVSKHAWSLALGAGGLICLPFLVKNQVIFGAPLHPFLSDIWLPPWIHQTIGEVTDRLRTDTYGVLGTARNPFNVVDWILSPETVSYDNSGRFAGFPPIYLLGLVAPVVLLKQSREWALLVVPVIVGVVGVLAVSMTTNLRYLLPYVPSAAILTGVSMNRILTFMTDWRRRAAFGCVLLFAASPTLLLLEEDLLPDQRYLVGLGFNSRNEWAHDMYQKNAPSYLTLAQLNEVLKSTMAKGERALLLYDGRGALYEVPVLQDNLNTNWPMLDDASGGRCISSDDISYVVWNQAIVEYLGDQGADRALIRRESFEDFAHRCLSLVAEPEGFEVYEVSTRSVEARRISTDTDDPRRMGRGLLQSSLAYDAYGRY